MDPSFVCDGKPDGEEEREEGLGLMFRNRLWPRLSDGKPDDELLGKALGSALEEGFLSSGAECKADERLAGSPACSLVSPFGFSTYRGS